MRWVVLTIALLTTGCSREPQRPAEPAKPEAAAPRPNPYGPEFQDLWNDGQAEVAAYSLVLPDGSRGEAVTITELQRFSASSRVPVNDTARSDVFPAIRLNVVQRYRTGIEERGNLLSVVIALSEINGLPAGAATGVSLSRQQWSGHAWRSLLFTKDRAFLTTLDGHSGESRKQVSFPGMRLPEDALPLAARRLGWPRLKLGQKYRADVLSSVEDAGEMQVSSVWLALPESRETVVTPAGSFRCHRFTATWPNGRTKTWLVQGDPPFRVVRWDFSSGERAELLGAERMNYSSARNTEAARKRLGLQ